jgi:uncharacterized protein (UPF0335 family)
MTEESYQQLVERVQRLEDEVRQLKQQGDSRPWWEKIAGSHKDDPVFAEIVRLGAAIRRAERRQSPHGKSPSRKRRAKAGTNARK